MTWSWRRCAALLLLGPMTTAATAVPAVAAVAPDWTSPAVMPATATDSKAAASTGTGAATAADVGPPPPAAAGRGSEGRPGGWDWPLRPDPEVLARFDPPDVPWGSGHRGVDLAATAGATVLAPTGGVVSFSGVVVDRGVVVVETPSGLRMTFEPVEDPPAAGVPVAQGQPLGRVSATPGHCRPQVCLHWGVLRGVLRGTSYLDPLAFLGRARVVLLPLRPP